MTVLDKSKADWSVHRQEAALDKDLVDHNRSNDRYVDKQVQLPLHLARWMSRPMVLILHSRMCFLVCSGNSFPCVLSVSLRNCPECAAM